MMDRVIQFQKKYNTDVARILQRTFEEFGISVEVSIETSTLEELAKQVDVNIAEEDR